MAQSHLLLPPGEKESIREGGEAEGSLSRSDRFREQPGGERVRGSQKEKSVRARFPARVRKRDGLGFAECVESEKGAKQETKEKEQGDGDSAAAWFAVDLQATGRLPGGALEIRSEAPECSGRWGTLKKEAFSQGGFQGRGVEQKTRERVPQSLERGAHSGCEGFLSSGLLKLGIEFEKGFEGLPPPVLLRTSVG